jgi:CRISPR-associated endonuclease/helicase Cas3
MELPYFWAKTTEDSNFGVSVYQHMINVGCVAQCLADMSQNILRQFNLRSSEIGALAALHDIGKISPGFQRKCQAWLEANNLLKIEKNGVWETIMEGDHGKVSHAIIQEFLNNQGVPRKIGSYLACVLGSHHGNLTVPSERGYSPQRAIGETKSGIDWKKAQTETANEIWRTFKAEKEYLNFYEESPAYWWLAGLTTIADWIGSDEHYFSTERQIELFDASTRAHDSIASIGLQQPVINPGLSFFDLFGFQANDIQRKAMSVITAPGVYVIEAPMGMGKTEAALGAAYQLLASGKAKGIYFALPTQATSNRIHRRMDKFIKRICPESVSTKLIHGNSWLMMGEISVTPKIEEKSGRDWFASAKKALVAPFGVGTIDQALLGVVAAKHFFVRHFALAGKVVILDEVHSYDLYTGTLIDKLITTLESLGCIVIVLSATLTRQRRDRILSFPDNTTEMDSTDMSYPLISGRREGIPIKSADAIPPASRDTYIRFIQADAASSKAVALAKKGGAVLWICDTVDSAQSTYKRLKTMDVVDIKLGLLHSRFPFWRREELEEEWMQRLGKDGKNRCGCILVSTQIVEQSVDLDADLIITELAPTDMLLQRMGRLWRHEREARPNSQPEFFVIEEEKTLSALRTMEAMAIKSSFGGKAYVYSPYILLRTLNLWKGISSITIPHDIRPLIESTYAELDEEPTAWSDLSNDWFGTNSAKEMLANLSSNIWQVALHDEEGVQTRLNEMPTITVILCTKNRKRRFVFIDGTEMVIEKSKYLLTIAQAISKNLVKIPKYCFTDKFSSNELLSDYLYGEQTVGIVSLDSTITVEGIQEMYSLHYTNEFGLLIRKTSEKERP